MDNAAQREVEFVATIFVDDRPEDNDWVQAVQDEIGHTGAKVIEVTYVQDLTDG